MTGRSGEPARVVLEGVPQVGYKSYQWCPFSACLAACLAFLGEEATYEFILGTSGAAFRLQWNSTGWDPGNVGILFMATDALEPFRRAFEAVGYSHEVILRACQETTSRSGGGTQVFGVTSELGRRV